MTIAFGNPANQMLVSIIAEKCKFPILDLLSSYSYITNATYIVVLKPCKAFMPNNIRHESQLQGSEQAQGSSTRLNVNILYSHSGLCYCFVLITMKYRLYFTCMHISLTKGLYIL